MKYSNLPPNIAFPPAPLHWPNKKTSSWAMGWGAINFVQCEKFLRSEKTKKNNFQMLTVLKKLNFHARPANLAENET